jgi:hypothetical protein
MSAAVDASARPQRTAKVRPHHALNHRSSGATLRWAFPSRFRLPGCPPGVGMGLQIDGWSFAFGVVVLTLAVRVFGRSEANFAEEL